MFFPNDYLIAIVFESVFHFHGSILYSDCNSFAFFLASSLYFFLTKKYIITFFSLDLSVFRPLFDFFIYLILFLFICKYIKLYLPLKGQKQKKYENDKCKSNRK